jgi:hypothetical protein
MAITLVQHSSATAQYTSGSSATPMATFGSNTTAGNCLIAVFSFTNSSSLSPTLTSVTTNGTAENWADSGASLPADNFFMYVDPNTGGGQTVVDVAFAFGGTATTSNSIAIMIDIFEVSGLTTSSVVDKWQSNLNTSAGTSWTSNATSTTTEATEIWIGAVNPGNNTANQTFTITGPSSPWTNEAQLSASIQNGGSGTSHKYYAAQMCGYQIVSSIGTATYSGTNTGSDVFYDAGVVTLKGAAANVNVNLTVAQVNIAAPAPTVTVKPSLTVSQVNINALALAGIHAGPISLPVAQVNINALAPAVRSGPVSLPVAQVNISAYPLTIMAGPVALPVAQVSITAFPFILGKSFALSLAQVTITAYPPGISRPGENEDSIVPLMVTGVYSNV